jgi:hypothetical protein
MLCNNDRVVVLISETAFSGKLMSKRDVQAFLRGEQISPGGEIYGVDEGEVVGDEEDEDDDDGASDIAREEDVDEMLADDALREERALGLGGAAGAEASFRFRRDSGDRHASFRSDSMSRLDVERASFYQTGIDETGGGGGSVSASARRDGVVVIGVGGSPMAARTASFAAMERNASSSSLAAYPTSHSRARPGSAASSAARRGREQAGGDSRSRRRSGSPAADRGGSRDSRVSRASKASRASSQASQAQQRRPTSSSSGAKLRPSSGVRRPLSGARQKTSGAARERGLHVTKPVDPIQAGKVATGGSSSTVAGGTAAGQLAPLSPGAFSTIPAMGLSPTAGPSEGFNTQLRPDLSQAGSRAGTEGSSGGALSPGGASSVASGAAPPGRQRKKFYKAPGVAKMRKAVHKLLLIKRFNSNWNPDMYGASTNTSGSGTINSSGDNNTVGGRRLFRRKQKKLGRTMDKYVAEQSNLYEYSKKRDAHDDQKVPWYLVTPQSNLKLCWDIVILCLVVWAAFRVPIRIGFDAKPSEYGFALLLLLDNSKPATLSFSSHLSVVQLRARVPSTSSPTPSSSSISSSTSSRRR